MPPALFDVEPPGGWGLQPKLRKEGRLAHIDLSECGLQRRSLLSVMPILDQRGETFEREGGRAEGRDGRAARGARRSSTSSGNALTCVNLSCNPLGNTGAKELSLGLSRNEKLVRSPLRPPTFHPPSGGKLKHPPCCSSGQHPRPMGVGA